MKIPSPYARRRARIEIIPLIDIMFFLLATFVMVSLSMIKNSSIAVNLPAAASGAPQDATSFTTIAVTDSGGIYLDQQPVDLHTLAVRLEAMKRADPDLRVFLHGDQQAAFGDAIRVLDELRLRGITKVALQTRATSIHEP